MSEANERGTLPPQFCIELINKQQDIIDSLVELNKLTINELAQHVNVENYELMISRILNGDDVIIE